MKKYKVIIDTDPGVDDSACIIFTLFDKTMSKQAQGICYIF